MSNVEPIRRKQIRRLLNYTKATWPKEPSKRPPGLSYHNPPPKMHHVDLGDDSSCRLDRR